MPVACFLQGANPTPQDGPAEPDAGCYPARVDSCPICSVSGNRVWIESEHAIAFPANEPLVDGHTIVVPRAHVASIHALPIAAQKGVWALVSEVRDRLRTGLVPDGGFAIGFVDGLTETEPVPHTVIHVIPRRTGDQVTLPECSEWISDDGLLASSQRGGLRS